MLFGCAGLISLGSNMLRKIEGKEMKSSIVQSIFIGLSPLESIMLHWAIMSLTFYLNSHYEMYIMAFVLCHMLIVKMTTAVFTETDSTHDTPKS